MKTISDYMHRSAITCRLNDSSLRVAKLMNDNQIRTVMVVDDTGGFWGVISVLDLMALFDKELDKISAEDVFRPFELTVDPQLPIEDAVVLMNEHQIEYLVIRGEGATRSHPVGILTSYDMVRVMARINSGRIMGCVRLKTAH